MKKLNITFGNNSAGAWLLCVFAGGESRPANRQVYGMKHYTSDFGPPFETYAQWHSDGLEIETPNFLTGVCMGTWKQTAGRTFKLFHVGWTPGGIRPPCERAIRVEASRYGQRRR